MTRKFMFFDNFKSTADKLPDELRLKFYDALTDYAFSGVEPEDPVISALVNALKPSLDKVEKRGGNHNPSGQNQHSEVKVRSKEVKKGQTSVKASSNIGQSGQSFLETETETRNVKEKDTLKSVQKEKTLFTPPSLDDVQKYIGEKGLCVDGKKFIDYFEAGHWRDSEGKPVKNWKQKLITWDSKGRTIRAAQSLLPRTNGVRSETYGQDIPL